MASRPTTAREVEIYRRAEDDELGPAAGVPCCQGALTRRGRILEISGARFGRGL